MRQFAPILHRRIDFLELQAPSIATMAGRPYAHTCRTRISPLRPGCVRKRNHQTGYSRIVTSMVRSARYATWYARKQAISEFGLTNGIARNQLPDIRLTSRLTGNRPVMRCGRKPRLPGGYPALGNTMPVQMPRYPDRYPSRYP